MALPNEPRGFLVAQTLTLVRAEVLQACRARRKCTSRLQKTIMLLLSCVSLRKIPCSPFSCKFSFGNSCPGATSHVLGRGFHAPLVLTPRPEGPLPRSPIPRFAARVVCPG